MPKIPTPCYPLPMKELNKEIRDFLDSIPGPKEPHQGSFCDLESHSDVKPKRKRGGQSDSQNVRNHSIYSKSLSPQHLELYKIALAIKDLSPEIALLRVKLNALLNDPTASPDLILNTLHVLGKPMNIKTGYIFG